eukprot:CAMPEP_0170594454 /NCGR_PEP_ID=MMETSP0224-20130122/14011_1 /TAXON_ID=285029 /ORGANISM="Togula jolla, Strain CCCM 725" /LENGTH=168 /DNA_ID=CAMNT_0010918517 /DNA_START=35 /DNA_END=537 /DNA_ORIENTATION=-
MANGPDENLEDHAAAPPPNSVPTFGEERKLDDSQCCGDGQKSWQLPSFRSTFLEDCERVKRRIAALLGESEIPAVLVCVGADAAAAAAFGSPFSFSGETARSSPSTSRQLRSMSESPRRPSRGASRLERQSPEDDNSPLSLSYDTCMAGLARRERSSAELSEPSIPDL